MTLAHRCHVPVMFWSRLWFFFLRSMRTHCIPRPLIDPLLQAELADEELQPVINKKSSRTAVQAILQRRQQPLEGDGMKQRRKKGMKKQSSHGKEIKQWLPPSSQRRRLRNPSEPMRRVIQSDIPLVFLWKVPESIWSCGNSAAPSHDSVIDAHRDSGIRLKRMWMYWDISGISVQSDCKMFPMLKSEPEERCLICLSPCTLCKQRSLLLARSFRCVESAELFQESGY